MTSGSYVVVEDATEVLDILDVKSTSKWQRGHGDNESEADYSRIGAKSYR